MLTRGGMASGAAAAAERAPPTGALAIAAALRATAWDPPGDLMISAALSSDAAPRAGVHELSQLLARVLVPSGADPNNDNAKATMVHGLRGGPAHTLSLPLAAPAQAALTPAEIEELANLDAHIELLRAEHGSQCLLMGGDVASASAAGCPCGRRHCCLNRRCRNCQLVVDKGEKPPKRDCCVTAHGVCCHRCCKNASRR